MSDNTPQLIADTACKVGENPLWHPFERRFLWLDIPTGTIYQYDPATGTYRVFYEVGEMTGGFTVQTDGALLLFGVGGQVRRLHAGTLTTVIESIPGEEHNRFNDAIADPEGRVYSGTMPVSSASKSGRLYRIETDGRYTAVLDGIQLSNGMAFSPDLTTFYHTDSPARTITAFDYDRATGDLSNPRLFTRLPEEHGVPDGMTVDAEGYIWSANWDGWRLVRYDPQGQVEREVRFPAKKVSSVIFGGDDISDIYATTAGGDNRAENGEHAGGVYRLRLGISGRPEFLSAIGTA